MKKYLLVYIESFFKWKGLLGLIIALHLFSFSLSFAGSAPNLINYQGMLTNAQGDPLETMEYKLSFSIFSQATGGTVIWGPQVFDGNSGAGHGAMVPVVRGHFNVILGPLDTSSRNILNAFATENAYLEITVGDGVAIAPRQQILSTPYAVHAVTADSATISTHHSNIIPVGTIVAFKGDNIPSGWYLCDGNNGTPDLRGMFLRGRNHNRSDGQQDPDGERAFGHYQKDEFKSHTHSVDDYTWCEIHGGNWEWMGSKDNDNDNGPTNAYKHNTYSQGGTETRPKNMAVDFIMYLGN